MPRLAVATTAPQGPKTSHRRRSAPDRPADAASMLGLQATRGNQAVLRMLGSNGAAPPRVHRSCACGGGTGAAGCECGDKPGEDGQHVQPKLTVSEPGDAEEEQADRTADTIMRRADGEPPIRAEAAPGDGARRPGRCAVSPAMASRISGLRSKGSPLPFTERAFFEARFGVDFAPVRVHTGGDAAAVSGALGARAFAVGADVAFAAGQYAPGTPDGRRLLAHELTHVVQQGGIAGMPSVARQADASTKPHKADDKFQLRSELHPSGKTRVAADQVASIYFATKSYVPDQDDHRVLKAVAEEYRPTAQAKAGLRGKVIGHADSEPSSDPDNHELSRQRARWTAAVLKSYLADSAKLSESALQFETEGLGTSLCTGDPDCARKVSPAALAPYRRADVIIFGGKTPGPETGNCLDCGALLGSCDFYRCRARDAGPDHTVRTYYLGYGLKYCERFSKVTRPKLSASGQDWVDKTLHCLQRYLHENVPCHADPESVKKLAFSSHPACYVTSGLCFLSPRDWSIIIDTIDASDNDMKQVLITAIYCAGNMLPMAFPITSLAAGGGYSGLMERDRRRNFGGAGGIRPFAPAAEKR